MPSEGRRPPLPERAGFARETVVGGGAGAACGPEAYCLDTLD